MMLPMQEPSGNQHEASLIPASAASSAAFEAFVAASSFAFASAVAFEPPYAGQAYLRLAWVAVGWEQQVPGSVQWVAVADGAVPADVIVGVVPVIVAEMHWSVVATAVAVVAAGGNLAVVKVFVVSQHLHFSLMACYEQVP